MTDSDNWINQCRLHIATSIHSLKSYSEDDSLGRRCEGRSVGQKEDCFLLLGSCSVRVEFSESVQFCILHIHKD